MNEFVNNVNRGRDIIQQSPQLIVDLDVESDGIAGHGSLLAIGAVTPWGEEFYRELKPTSDIWIEGNREFCESHGLQRDRLLCDGMEPAQVMKELDEWTRMYMMKYGKAAAVLAAYNASYDFPLIGLEFERAGLENPYGHAGYCTESLVMAFEPNYDWRASGKKQFGPDVRPTGELSHNALEDAIYQQQFHFALIGKYARRGAAMLDI
jgi:DNA polymerase III epsilon subunit-like protein